jgi:phenolic acid decarboxylase
MKSNPSSAIDVFDQRTLSYTYDNGWEFTNFFEGNLRTSTVEGRGELRETVVVTKTGKDLYFVAWEDDEMGLITQIIDLGNNTLQAAVLLEGNVDIWSGKITSVT